MQVLSANVEARIKHAGTPERFLSSEVALDVEVRALGALAASPELYPAFLKLGALTSVLSLLAHDNTDIVADAVALISELTDAEAAGEAEDEVEALLDAVEREGGFSALAMALVRMDETSPDEAAAVTGVLACFENASAAGERFAAAIVAKTCFLEWVLKRINVSAFDTNKAAASEVLAILCQSAPKARDALVAKEGGLDAVLRAIAPYKRRAPAGGDEEEHLQNLFDVLCCAVTGSQAGRIAFMAAEGVELMCIVARSKEAAPAARVAAFRALDFACARNGAACERLVDVRGLGTVFAAFMGKGAAAVGKKGKKGDDGDALSDERVVSLVASLATELDEADARLDRLLSKFVESDYEKLDRLFELLDGYLERFQYADDALPANMDEAEREVELLDRGLFSARLVGCILAVLWTSGDEGARFHIIGLLELRGKGRAFVAALVRDHLAGLGADEGNEKLAARLERAARQVEQAR